MVYMV